MRQYCYLLKVHAKSFNFDILMIFVIRIYNFTYGIKVLFYLFDIDIFKLYYTIEAGLDFLVDYVCLIKKTE